MAWSSTWEATIVCWLDKVIKRLNFWCPIYKLIWRSYIVQSCNWYNFSESQPMNFYFLDLSPQSCTALTPHLHIPAAVIFSLAFSLLQLSSQWSLICFRADLAKKSTLKNCLQQLPKVCRSYEFGGLPALSQGLPSSYSKKFQAIGLTLNTIWLPTSLGAGIKRENTYKFRYMND